MYQLLLNFLSSSFGGTWTTAAAPTTVSGNGTTYTAPANIGASQQIDITGNNDHVTSNAANLVIIDQGNNDTITTASHNVTFVAEGASDTLTLTSAAANLIIDLTLADTGAAAATVLNASKDTASFQNTSYSCSYSSFYVSCAVPYLNLNGSADKLRLGNYNVGLQLNGADNIVVGGCATSYVSTAATSGANAILGGSGTMVLNSAVAGMSAIGGSGTLCATLTGDFANVFGGSGSLNATLNSNFATLETGSGSACVTINGMAATIVSGSGNSKITYTDPMGGGLLYQGAANDVCSEFDVNANGAVIYGGDIVKATGSNLTISSRAAAATDQGGAALSQIASVVFGETANLLPDSDVAAAFANAGLTFLPSGVTATSTGYCCSTLCGPSSYHGYRQISVTGSNDTINNDARSMFVTVNGTNNVMYGGTVGQVYWIQSGDSNLYYAGAGNNLISGNGGQTNTLEYLNAPNPTYVNLACNYACNGYGGVDWVYNMNRVEIGANSTVIGGYQSATLIATGDHSTVQGGYGTDTLSAFGNNETLIAGAGSDTITTTGTANSYVIGQYGTVPLSTIINQQATGVTGTLGFLACTQPAQLWFATDKAGDLVIDVLGTAKSITVDNWFSAGTQLASISAGGKSLGNPQINALETAMANYQAAHPGFDPTKASAIPTDPAIQSAYAGWH